MPDTTARHSALVRRRLDQRGTTRSRSSTTEVALDGTVVHRARSRKVLTRVQTQKFFKPKPPMRRGVRRAVSVTWRPRSDEARHGNSGTRAATAREYDMALTLVEARRKLRSVGYAVRRQPAGDYRVSPIGGCESESYYTEDLGDALATGLAEAKAAHSWVTPTEKRERAAFDKV